MKWMFLIFLWMMMSSLLCAQNRLVVTIEGINVKKGSVMVGLFSDQQTFLKKAKYGNVLPVEGEITLVIFENIEPGEYGISVIHDRNNNGELDTNILGIPKEGFGFGNNTMGVFGPPSFDKAKISIDTGRHEHLIRVRYF